MKPRKQTNFGPFGPRRAKFQFFSSSVFIAFLAILLEAKGRLPVPNSMNFRKTSKRPLTPPYFRKKMLRFLQRNFSECSDPTLFLYRKSATKFFGSEMTPPFWKLSENSSNMVEIVTPKKGLKGIIREHSLYLPDLPAYLTYLPT